MVEAHAGTLLNTINSGLKGPARAGHVKSPAKAGQYVRSGWLFGVAIVAAAVFATACASSGRNPVPPGTAQPDQYLFEKGNDALQKKKWLTAREYFKQVTETYTQSPLRPD